MTTTWAEPPSLSATVQDDPSSCADAPLLRNSVALIVNAALTSGLGLVFWSLAARRYPAEQIGASAAVVSLLVFLANVSELNLSSVLTRFLPTAGSRSRRYLLTAYASAASLGLGVAIVALWILHSRLALLGVLTAKGPLGVLWFAGAVSVWCVFALQDAAAVALRGAAWVPFENALFGLAKITAVVILATASPTLGILIAWTLPMALTLPPMNALILCHLLPRGAAIGHRVEDVSRKEIGTFLSAEYLTSLAVSASATFVPLMVAAHRADATAGHFYLVWIIGLAIEAGITALGALLVAEGARNPDTLGAPLRHLLAKGAIVMTPLLVVALIVGPMSLDVLGSGYSEEGSGLLRLLLLGLIGRTVIVAWMSVNRVLRRTDRVLLVQLALTGSLVGGTALLMWAGSSLTAIGLLYLAVHSAGALLLAPGLLRTTSQRTGPA